ncbi:MAG: response regulator [Fimbriimonadaceae bacterium]|nr:response regulator [Chitinophagales bacterium]
MIKVILIDDEPLARSIVKEYLLHYPEIEIIQECNDGFEGVKAITQYNPDLIFLDIQMPKINGFEMLELLENPPAIIFTTAFDEYALKAFEAHAVDYLLKPFNKERFDKAMQKCLPELTDRGGVAKENNSTSALLETISHTPPQSQRIVVKLNNKIKIIPFQEIQYIGAEGDYVMIYTAEGNYLKNKTMAFFENTLDPNQFVRTHRSYILNIQLVTRLEAYEKDSHVAILKTGARVPVSKSGYTKLKVVLGI